MSLYEGLDDKGGAGGSWSSAGLKLLQSQIALKKAQATQAMRERTRAQPSAPSPVIDLSSRKRSDQAGGDSGDNLASSDAPFLVPPPAKQRSLLNPRKPVMLDQLPLSFIPPAAKEPTVIFGEFTVEDEYNPLIPNDYVKCYAAREARRKIQREADNLKEIELAKLRAADMKQREDKQEEEREQAKRTLGAAIAPPQALMEQDKKVLETPMPPPSVLGASAGPKGMNLAARMMEKMGYKKGGGLGRTGQGMTTALTVEKVGVNEGKIIHENDMKAETSSDGFAVPLPVARPGGGQMAAPAPLPPIPATRQTSSQPPTKCVLLRNMVGKGEVDDELEPEIKEEMTKYGEVINVMIYEQPDNVATESDAIRIFVEYDNLEHSRLAIESLNGRFFGGRTVLATYYDFDKYKNFELSEVLN